MNKITSAQTSDLITRTQTSG